MKLMQEAQVALAGGRAVDVRFLRAERGDDALASALVDIDLQSFVEATVPRAVAEIVLHHGMVHLLEVDGAIVGSVLSLRDWERPDEGVIASVGLLPGWRGRGLGPRLLTWLLEALAAEGLSAVTLHVGSNNRRALQLYEDAGFTRLRHSPPDPVSGERSLVLRRALH